MLFVASALFSLGIIPQAAHAQAASGVAFTTLHSFSIADVGGDFPNGSLTLGSDGNYYGVTSTGEDDSLRGTVFKLSPGGVLTTLYVFSGGDDGIFPGGKLALGRDGNFYGTTQNGGANDGGTVYKITPAGVETVVYSFTDEQNSANQTELTVGSDGNFYGATPAGGANGAGEIFKMTPAGTLTVLHSFGAITTHTNRVSTNADGYGAGFALTPGSDGSFYGVAPDGGTNGAGTVFKITPAGVFTLLYSFDIGTGGDFPAGSLTLASDGDFYGTAQGGANENGTIYKITPAGALTVLYSFSSPTSSGSSGARGVNASGADPIGALVQNSDGSFYGVSEVGGVYGYGTLFKFVASGTLTTLHSFTSMDAGDEVGSPTFASDGSLIGTSLGGPDGLGAVYNLTASGAFNSYYPFGVSAGMYPSGGLAAGSDGNFYGTTSSGTDYNNGTLFSITPSGQIATLYEFGHPSGAMPYDSLTVGLDGALYGTTSGGGDNGRGTIFESTLDGDVTVLYSFSAENTNLDNLDGTSPYAHLVADKNGNLYGTAPFGGANGTGTIFKLTPDGTFTTLHSFAAASSSNSNVNSDGMHPESGLCQGSDGNFYGGTLNGGAYSNGVLFQITPSGTFTLLHTFSDRNGANYSNADGATLAGPLVLGSDGDLYGAASSGGTGGSGTLFKMTPSGTFITLYSFTAAYYLEGGGSNPNYLGYFNTEGCNPSAALLLGTDGVFYGTTYYGSSGGNGVIYSITPSGQFNVVYAFSSDKNGSNADGALLRLAPLIESNDGTLYGVAEHGGTSDEGTVFKITVPSLAASIAPISRVSLNPTTVVGGSASSMGTVTLTAPAPSTIPVALSSSNTSAAVVPASVVVAAGASSAKFTVTTKSVTAAASVIITATAGSTSKTAALKVTPANVSAAALSKVTLSPATLVGGATEMSSRIYLTGDAVATTKVTLTSSNTQVAMVPSTVTIDSGYSSHVFTITTKAVTTTTTVTITATSGSVTKTAILTVTPAAAPTPSPSSTRFDFNRDGHADLIWYNTGSGALSVWDMNDSSVLSYGATFAQLAPSSGWMPVAAPDANGDGSPDLLWWNKNTGELSIWTLNNTAVTNYGADFATLSDTTWKPVAVADNQGSNWTLVFQNSTTGNISTWQMSGTTVTSYSGTLGSVGAGSGWQCVGAPDLNGDGHSDLLFWNSQTGEVSWWGCNLGAQQVLSYNADFAQVSDTTWHLQGSEDTNGDGHPDLIWWNASSGIESRWLLSGTTVTQYGGVSTQVNDTTWQPTAIR